MELKMIGEIAQSGAVGVALVLCYILWKMHGSFMAQHASFMDYIDKSENRHIESTNKQNEILENLNTTIGELNKEIIVNHNDVINRIDELKRA